MDRPYVICHMLTSLDGKIDGDFMSSPANMPALREYGAVRDFYGCPATIYGTTTMVEGFADGLVSGLPVSTAVFPREDYAAPSDVQNYIVSVDPQGILAWSSKYLEKKGRPKAHVIEALTEQVSNEYLTYLRNFDISYIFAGTDRLDCGLLLKKLEALFGIEKVMLAGGGLVNWSFAQEDLIDELSIVLSPTADGRRETAALFEKADFLPPRPAAAFTLEGVEQKDGGVLWLRYSLRR